MTIYIGTASWSIPSVAKDKFDEKGSHLERYSRNLNAVEINSSFYRDHLSKTYLRWKESVPNDFKFSIKLSRYFTHEKKLEDFGKKLGENLTEISSLGEKLGAVLIQLPPKLEFKDRHRRFFDAFREVYSGPAVIEPRNKSWTAEGAFQMLKDYRISKVVADPEVCSSVCSSGSKEFCYLGGLSYFRLHGSPEIYKSNYETKYLQQVLNQMLQNPLDSWIIFDNTTFGYATLNALELKNLNLVSSNFI